MSDIDVSIVVACFNERPDRLTQALDSALAQRGASVEVVVVDDGSDDAGTIETLEAYADRVTLLRQSNRGLPAARNVAIAASSGRYILPLDSDDWFADDVAAIGRDALDADPKAVIAYTHIVQVRGPGLEEPAPDRTQQFIVADLALGNTLPVSSLFRRADWARLGGYDESLAGVGHEDYEWWVRLLADGGVAAPAVGAMFYYRVRPDSMSKRMERLGTSLATTRAAMLRNSPGVERQLLEGLWQANAHLLEERRGLLMERAALHAQLARTQR